MKRTLPTLTLVVILAAASGSAWAGPFAARISGRQAAAVRTRPEPSPTDRSASKARNPDDPPDPARERLAGRPAAGRSKIGVPGRQVVRFQRPSAGSQGVRPKAGSSLLGRVLRIKPSPRPEIREPKPFSGTIEQQAVP